MTYIPVRSAHKFFIAQKPIRYFYIKDCSEKSDGSNLPERPNE